MELSRRSFLLGSGAALAGGALAQSAGGREPHLPADDEIEQVCRFISQQWHLTIRRSNPGDPSETPLPKPFTVPTAGKTFHYFFYWDTYFTSVGLLLDARQEQARNNADNMIELVRQLGFVPNITAASGQNRTQLPVASALYADVFRWSRDTRWLADACSAMEREHAFFSAMRATPCGLNRAYHHATPSYLWQFAEEIAPRLPHLPREPQARLQASGHALAECEVWDFTPRFAGRCADFCPLDTNALLYLLERNAAACCGILGRGEPAAALWRTRAERRAKRLSELCWNEKSGMFFDYDWVNRRQSDVASAANFFVLWAGAASGEQAARIAQNLDKLEFPHGITTCVPSQQEKVFQWDHPNAWPPLQFAAMEGLRRYGHGTQARRIAAKYVETVTRNFKSTGNLWEKYNAVTGGMDARNEYDMPPMLGWTAGVLLHALRLLDSSEETPPAGVLESAR